MLTEDGFDQFNVHRVLNGAGISQATLCNHFTDVDTLIEVALVATFTQETDLYQARLAGIVDEAPDQDAFRDKLRSLIRELSRLPPPSGSAGPTASPSAPPARSWRHPSPDSRTRSRRPGVPRSVTPRCETSSAATSIPAPPL